MTYYFETFSVDSEYVANVICGLINRSLMTFILYSIIDWCDPDFDFHSEHYIRAKVEERDGDDGEKYYYISGKTNYEKIKEFWENGYKPALTIEFKKWEAIEE